MSILANEIGNLHLADFGLPTTFFFNTNNCLKPYKLIDLRFKCSRRHGPMDEHLSSRLIALQQFELRESLLMKPSDCCLLGMVIYENVSGNLLFHSDTDYVISLKVVDGWHPPLGTKFMEGLWKM
jgi:hypothetical protein